MGEKRKRAAKLAVILSLAIAVTSFMPLKVSAAVKAPAKKVFYMDRKYEKDENRYLSVSFIVTGIKKDDYIKVSSLKSSKKKVVEVTDAGGVYYFDKDKEKSSVCEIYGKALKPGKSTISYKIGKSKKKTDIIVKDYENPIKKITLDGVNNGKDFSKLTKKTGYVETEYDENWNPVPVFDIEQVKHPVLTVVPATGWSIQDVAFFTGSTMESYYYYEGKELKGKQSFKLYELKDEGFSNLNITFVNKNGGVIDVKYDMANYSY